MKAHKTNQEGTLNLCNSREVQPHIANKETATVNMESPLSPLSPSKANALGSNIPSPSNLTPNKMAPGSPAKSPLKTQIGANKQATPVRSNVYDDGNNSETDWDEGRSSPFVSQLVEDKENARFNTAMTSRSSSSGMTEDIHRDFDDMGLEDAPPTVTKLRTPFKIAEDETSTFHSTRSVVSRTASPAKPTLSRTSTQSSSESVSVTTHSSYESRSNHRVISFGTEAGDFTAMEDANIDDTCFSTFSEVPNTDMTAFARLGQRSPTKQMMFDQVSLSFGKLFYNGLTGISRHHARDLSLLRGLHALLGKNGRHHPLLVAEWPMFQIITIAATPQTSCWTSHSNSKQRPSAKSPDHQPADLQPSKPQNQTSSLTSITSAHLSKAAATP